MERTQSKEEKDVKAPLRPSSIELDGAWKMAYTLKAPTDRPRSLRDCQGKHWTHLPAEVPGNLELDLLRAGLIEDPFFGMNMVSLFPYEKAHVCLERAFEGRVPASHRAVLVFEGVDCCGELFLNGERLGQVDNMLVEHAFDVTDRLRGRNEMFVHLRPALVEAERYDYPVDVRAGGVNCESLYVRKAPHMYGWDIMPRALSAGLWRPVRLEFLPASRLDRVFLETLHLSEDRSRAEMLLHYWLSLDRDDPGPWEILLEGQCGGSGWEVREPVRFPVGKTRFAVDEPLLWWPNGAGEPQLYQAKAALLGGGRERDVLSFRTGIRTVKLERTSLTDDRGSGQFQIFINGEKIFCKGSNWVPLDAYHSRDRHRVERAVDLAVGSHCNILRCWGGNVYESDLFFDLCDERGLMVWQDFAMACAAYPQDEAFARRLAEEAGKVVRRLRNHPSLVLWAGDNECDQAYAWMGLGDPNLNVLTRGTLPEVLRQEDPRRPYLPSSPYIDREAYAAGGHPLPEDHLWGPRGYYKGDYYVNALAHFASEIGYHGCPDPESVRAFISPDKLWPPWNNEEWRLHGTSPVPGYPAYDGRVQLMANQLKELFGEVPDDLESFAFASQATQAEAKKFFIERFRAGKWRRTGIIWWNLLDGWPQFSDAVVDYYFRPKLAYRAIARSQQHVCLMLLEPEGMTQELVVCNDTLKTAPLEYEVKDAATGRSILMGEARAKANAVTRLDKIPYHAKEQRFYLIEWNGPGFEGANHYLAGSPPFSLDQVRKGYACAGY